MSQRERPKTYGHGRWRAKQFWAIVGGYRSRGREAEWVARKLGVGDKLVRRIYAYFDEQEADANADQVDELDAWIIGDD